MRLAFKFMYEDKRCALNVVYEVGYDCNTSAMHRLTMLMTSYNQCYFLFEKESVLRRGLFSYRLIIATIAPTTIIVRRYHTPTLAPRTPLSLFITIFFH
jgi:hypothetical protein